MAKKHNEHETVPADLILPELGPHPKTGEQIERTKPDLSEFNDGKGYVEKATGREFGLKIEEDDPRGNTHHLKNEFQSWAGNKADFEKAFEKK